jgi:hypothetical protein
MKRLNDRAFLVLDEELKRLCAGKPDEQVRRTLILKRLEKFRRQEGRPLGYDDLKETVQDIFPEFSDKVLRQAARLNRAPAAQRMQGPLRWVAGIGVGGALVAGSLWVLNLPYPMIRWPVARTAPLLLLPSFMQMDHHYRQAIVDGEQADQLINNATSAADFELGAEKAAQAQKHLDGLPVWFLGYYPRRYCTLFSCSWQFTLDEFKAQRERIGRMEAQIFQEQNALKQLEEGTLAVETARRRYEAVQTSEEKLAILATWQTGMDQLAEIPAATLAGKTAQTRLQAFQRDYQTLAGTSAHTNQSNTFVQAAKQYATRASEVAQNPPHSVDTWGRAALLWEKALGELRKVPAESPGYLEAQMLTATYTDNLAQTKERQALEQRAVQALSSVEDRVIRLIAIAPQQPSSETLAELQAVINRLQNIPAGTTAYPKAQQLLLQASDRLTQLQATNVASP